MILIICSLFSFLGNSALLGPSVYIVPFSEQFGISPTTASGLISYPNVLCEYLLTKYIVSPLTSRAQMAAAHFLPFLAT